jgi:hypothetical protein
MAPALQTELEQLPDEEAWCPYQPMKTRLDKGNLVLLQSKMSLKWLFRSCCSGKFADGCF